MRGIAVLLAGGTIAALLSAPERADARPAIFAEGMFGLSFGVGTDGYTEDHDGASVQAGLRGGIWLPARAIDRRVGGVPRGRRTGFELQVDRTSYGAGYYYYQDVMNPDGTTSTVRVDPEYSRLRVLGGVRVAMPMYNWVDLVLRAAGGIDRVSGTSEEIAAVVEVGVQVLIRLGPVRVGVEGSIPVAFHDNEQAESPGIGPQYGHRPGYDRAVDGIGSVIIGAVF